MLCCFIWDEMLSKPMQLIICIAQSLLFIWRLIDFDFNIVFNILETNYYMYFNSKDGSWIVKKMHATLTSKDSLLYVICWYTLVIYSYLLLVSSKFCHSIRKRCWTSVYLVRSLCVIEFVYRVDSAESLKLPVAYSNWYGN